MMMTGWINWLCLIAVVAGVYALLLIPAIIATICSA